MKHLKSFILGMIVGALFFGGLSVVAQQYSIVPNPFEVFFNDHKIDIEGYNINNSTYFKLKDIGQYVGFDVDFANNQIQISTIDKVSSQDIKEDIMKIDDYTITKNGDIYYRATIFATPERSANKLPSGWKYYGYFLKWDGYAKTIAIYSSPTSTQPIIVFTTEFMYDGAPYISKTYCDEYIIPTIEAYLNSIE